MSDAFVPYPPGDTFVPFKMAYLEAHQAAAQVGAAVPRLPSQARFFGTVKLHGTHAAMVFRGNDKQSPQFQSRHRVIDIAQDNRGTVAHLSSAPLHELVDQILEIFGAKSFKEIMVVGEMAGRGINKGVAIAHVPRFFAIFNIRIDGAWVDMRRYASIALREHRIFNLAAWPTYEVDIDFTISTSAVSAKITAQTDDVVRACPVGLALADEMEPAWTGQTMIRAGEGIVWTLVESLEDGVLGPLDRGQICNFKTRGVAFAKTAHAPRFPPSPKKVAKAQEFAQHALTESRLQQGVEFVEQELARRGKAGETAYQHAERYLFTTWVKQDAIKNEKRALRDMGVDKNLAEKYLHDMAKLWITARVNAVCDACTLPNTQ